MMNDQELATAVRKSVDGVRMSVPEEQIVSRSRAIRAARRRRLAAGVTAAVSAGVAAIAAAVLLPGPAVPATQDTAYVVSHVAQALDAMPAGTILFSQTTVNANGSVTDMWDRTGQSRFEAFTQAGQLKSESGRATTRTAITVVSVNYLHKTWSRSVFPAHAAAPAPSFTCASVASDTDPVFFNSRQMAAWLRASVSCGTVKADGTATVYGVTAIKLVKAPRNTPGVAVWGTITYFVNPTTYLPVRLTLASGVNVRQLINLQWLPPTAANLAKLDLPVVPRGFTQASP
ncbi:MAG TPA: hypothetical protein VI365_24750 [Trebonia sp.]